MAEVIAELVGRLSFEVDDKGLKRFNKGLEDGKKKAGGARKELRRVGTRLTSLGKIAGTAALAVTGLATALGTKLVGSFVESGREIDRWSKIVGTSVEELQRLDFAAEQVGAESDNIREAITTLRENLGEMARVGSGPAVDALGTLGIELEEIQGLGATEQLELFATALGELEDDSQRTSVALEVLGDDGKQLLPLFQQGAQGIRELTDRADELGIVLDQSAIDRSVEAGIAIDELSLTAKGLGQDLVVELIPTITEVAGKIREWIGENRELIAERVSQFIDGVVSAGETLIDVVGEAIDFMDDFDGRMVAAAATAGTLAIALGGIPGIIVAIGGALAVAAIELSDFGDKVLDLRQAIGRVTNEQVGATARAGERRVAREQESTEVAKRLNELRDPRKLAAMSDEAFEREVGELIEASASDPALGAATDRAINNISAQRSIAQSEQRGQDLIFQARQGDAGARARRRARFQRDALSGGGGKVDTRRAEALFAEQLEPLARAAGLGGKALGASFEAAAQSLKRGASEQVALQAGIGQLESLSGLQLAGSADAALFGLLTRIGGEQAAQSATAGARFVRIDQSVNLDVTFEIPPGLAEQLAQPGGIDAATESLRSFLIPQIQTVIDRWSGGPDA